MHGLTAVPWHLIALLIRDTVAYLLVDSVALFGWYINTFLAGNLAAIIVGDLLGPLLGHIIAGIISVLITGSSNRGPDLGGSLAFPLVLAVILESIPGPVCLSLKFSSANFSP